MEIERKWHMIEAPALPERTHTQVFQSYLSLLPELRIRRYVDLGGGMAERFDLTVKSEGTLAREEIIKELTAEEYRILLEMTGGLPPIVKDHRTYDWQGYILEYSLVDPGTPVSFTYAEVEFPTVAEAKAFQAPDWFGEDITEKPVFRMRTHWKNTRHSPAPEASGR